MTVVKETADYERYIKIQFVEFLELIARIAYSKYKDTDQESEPLHELIFLVIETIAALYGRTANPSFSLDVEESESDEDY